LKIVQLCVPWVCRSHELEDLIVSPIFDIVDLERRSLTSTWGSKLCCTDSAVDFTEEPCLILIGSQNSLECTDSYIDSV
jgi:hypothetical protein